MTATFRWLSLEKKACQMLQGCSWLYPSSVQGMCFVFQTTASAFVGTKVYAECHSSEAATQIDVPTAHAGKLASNSEVLRVNTDMPVRAGP